MKQITAVFLLAMGLLCLLPQEPARALETAPVYVNGQQVQFDAAPYIYNYLLMAPVRPLAEAIDADINWNGQTQQATVTRAGDRLVLKPGADQALYNGIPVPLETAPQSKEGRTYLPLRAIAEWLQLQVDFKGGGAYLTAKDQREGVDTLTKAKGNSNGNLSAGGEMFPMGNVIYTQSHFIEQLQKQDNSLNQTNFAKGNYSHFNLWQGSLYAIKDGDVVKLAANGAVAQTLVNGAGYCQIQDGWLYYTQGDAPYDQWRLFRKSLSNGQVQSLDIRLLDQLVITDQHIYTYYGGVLLRTALDGSQRENLLLIDGLKALEYADGRLYFTLDYQPVTTDGSEDVSRICSVKTDGTDLRQISSHGAESINIAGDWVYYSKIEPFGWSDSGYRFWQGCEIWRMKKDGGSPECLTTKPPEAMEKYCKPMIFGNTLYYMDFQTSNFNLWRQIPIEV